MLWLAYRTQIWRNSSRLFLMKQPLAHALTPHFIYLFISSSESRLKFGMTFWMRAELQKWTSYPFYNSWVFIAESAVDHLSQRSHAPFLPDHFNLLWSLPLPFFNWLTTASSPNHETSNFCRLNWESELTLPRRADCLLALTRSLIFQPSLCSSLIIKLL